jgi:hypothetical protein
MRRQEIIHGINEIQAAIEQSEIRQYLTTFLDSLRPTTKEKPTGSVHLDNLIDSLKRYSILASRYSPAAKQISEIFNLSMLEDTSVWSRLFSGEVRVAGEVNNVLKFAKVFLPRVGELLQQEALALIERSVEKADPRYSNKLVLTVIVVEEGDHFSSPARIVEVVSSVASLYEAYAILLELPPEEISVVACDSGSDKSFDFLGAAKVMDAVKTLVLALWDRIVFFREKQVSERIELIAGSLPVIEEITRLESEGKLGPEQAEILRRKIIDGVSKFIENGAVIPEMEGRAQFSPRLLMMPEQKLLGSGSHEHSEEPEHHRQETESDDVDISALTEEERDILTELLKKSRPKKRRSRRKKTDETEQ